MFEYKRVKRAARLYVVNELSGLMALRDIHISALENNKAMVSTETFMKLVKCFK